MQKLYEEKLALRQQEKQEEEEEEERKAAKKAVRMGVCVIKWIAVKMRGDEEDSCEDD